MGIYDDKPAPTRKEEVKQETSNKETFNEITYAFDIPDSVIYLVGEIDGFTLFDMMTRIRTILNNRTEENADQPINMIINSEGGCVYEMLAIVDYMKSLAVPINTICRGKAFSAAAVILANGTGTRYASKHSTIMFHQSSAWLQGKQADVKASIHHVSEIDDKGADLNYYRTLNYGLDRKGRTPKKSKPKKKTTKRSNKKRTKRK